MNTTGKNGYSKMSMKNWPEAAISNLLILRTDASKEIGIGHFIRCLALAQAWCFQGGRAVFISRIDKETLVQWIRGDNCELIRIKNELSVIEELELVYRYFNPKKEADANGESAVYPATWIAVDGYHFGEDYHHGLKEAGYKVLIIDDKAHLPFYHAHILLNQNIGSSQIPYRCSSETLPLLGLKYVLLRKEFGHHRKDTGQISRRPKNIIITCGGVDSKNITQRAVCALKQLNRKNLSVQIIIGPENPHLMSIRRELQSAPFQYRLMENVKEMPDLLGSADLAITAAGSTSWEAANMGVPNINMILSDNQERTALKLHETGAARTLGWWHTVDSHMLAKAVSELLDDYELRKDMNRKAKRLVDDLGALRVCRIMRFFSAGYQATNFRIRSVGPEDSNLLFRLANDPETRQNAFRSNPLSFEEHAQWLDKKMNDSQTTAMYVLEYEGAVLAQIRYDKIYPDTADINISVHPAFRRRGYGTAMLIETRNAAGKQLEISSFRSVVFQENDASRHCFIKAGFREKEKTMMKDRTCFIYGYRLNTHAAGKRKTGKAG